MEFREALTYLLNGCKIRRPGWEGYWSWEDSTVMMYCKDGKILDIRLTDDVAFTLSNIAADDWEVIQKKPMELRDTVEGMLSEDYKDRFKAEYHQLAIRAGKLKAMVEKWDSGQLEFTPTCPIEIYRSQICTMEIYLALLRMRAAAEKVDL